MKLTRLALFLFSAAGLMTAIMGLFTGNSLILVIGFLVSALGLMAAVLQRGKCSSCQAPLTGEDGETLCSSCEHTLLRHLPRLSAQIKTRPSESGAMAKS